MNHRQKHLSACLFALAAIFSTALTQGAWAATAPALGTASGFTILGGTAVTCTNAVITGDVGSGGAFTNTGCTIGGAMPPATNTAEVGALSDFLRAYTAIQSMPCDHTLLSTITGPVTLAPGVYCTGAALTGTGVLTLDGGGDANAVWIFKIGAALTGTGFSVVMANGGQPCNVYWAPSGGVTMTSSTFSGNILAGDPIGGSITLTDVTLSGRALADVAVTMTRGIAVDCGMLSGSKGHKSKDHKKCNQGVGNGPEGCDPGNSNQGNPFGSNDENGGTPGNPGRKGGNK